MSHRAEQLRALMDSVTSPDPARRGDPAQLAAQARAQRGDDRDDLAALQEATELLTLLRKAGLLDNKPRTL